MLFILHGLLGGVFSFQENVEKDAHKCMTNPFENQELHLAINLYAAIITFAPTNSSSFFADSTIRGYQKNTQAMFSVNAFEYNFPNSCILMNMEKSIS
jgi:hypothetical protein